MLDYAVVVGLAGGAVGGGWGRDRGVGQTGLLQEVFAEWAGHPQSLAVLEVLAGWDILGVLEHVLGFILHANELYNC